MAGQNGKSSSERGVPVPRLRRIGGLKDLQARYWAAIQTVWRLMRREGATVAEQLNCAHALNQLGGGYRQILQDANLNAEIEALRDEIQALKKSEHVRKVI